MATPPVVQNMVFTANLLRVVDVKILAEKIKGHYDPNDFPACTWRCRYPDVTASVYTDGNIVMVGGKSYDKSLWAFYIFLDKVRKTFVHLRHHVEAHNLKLQNMVASFTIGFEVNLPLMFDDFRDRTSYSEEDIGSLRLWPQGMLTSLMLTVWRTGKAHVAGAKTNEEVEYVHTFVDFSKYKLGHEYRMYVPRPAPEPPEDKPEKTDPAEAKALEQRLRQRKQEHHFDLDRVHSDRQYAQDIKEVLDIDDEEAKADSDTTLQQQMEHTMNVSRLFSTPRAALLFAAGLPDDAEAAETEFEESLAEGSL